MLTLGLAVAIVVVILDQLSKAAILGFFAAHPFSEPLTPFFSLVLGYNRGMSFGFFNAGASGLNALIFSLVAAAIVVALIWWLVRVTSPFLAVAIGLIIGGAVGNVIDRLRLGAVVDFSIFMLAYGIGPPSISPIARFVSVSRQCCSTGCFCAVKRVK